VSDGKSARRHLRTARPSTVGRLLKQWRERRRMSQLSLALEAEISTRHLSFLETGRTQPSREMVLLLGRVLEVPLRSRNDLLTAAGYAPVYRETGLDAPEMAQVKQALGFMLRQQEPCPAMVLDRHWNILMTNDAMGRVMGLFLDPNAAASLGPANAMRLSYHPQGLRPYIVNWRRPRRPSSSGSTAISCARATPRPSSCSTSSWPIPTCRASGRRSTWTRRPRRFSRSS